MPDLLHHLHFFRATTGGHSEIPPETFRLATTPTQLPPMPKALVPFRDIHASRFAEGHAAVLGESNGTLAFIAWLAFGTLRIDELARTWHIPERSAVLYDVNTMPEHRGRGLYTSALRWVLGTLAGMNVSRCWIYAEQSNTASLRGIAKAGFAHIGSMRSFRIGNCALRLGRVAESGL
ncbi:MAG: GNAT family N-acetyltransferase [Bacteroidia bacterium]|nr:GNAT family N-acetyltransferase [Bacteroidia bacterium]